MITIFMLAALAASPRLEPVAESFTLPASTVEVARYAACGRSVSCWERRSFDVRLAAAKTLSACGDVIPREHCLVLVATLKESRANSHPTCAPRDCVAMCGNATSGPERHCRIACADELGDIAARRAERCNDGGTSSGWFQMKRAMVDNCSRWLGRDIDPHKVEDAAVCYANYVRRSYRMNKCGIRDDDTRWRVSFARVAAGPWLRGSREPRCSMHNYAVRAAEAQDMLAGNYERAVIR